MPRPADAAIAHVGPAEGLDHLAVAREVRVRRPLDLALRRAQRGIQLSIEVLFDIEEEAVFPRFGRDIALLVRTFVHVERVQVAAIHTELVAQKGDRRIERLGVRQDDNVSSPLIGRLLDATEHRHHQVKGELLVLQDRHLQIGVLVSCEVGARECTRPLARCLILKWNPRSHLELETFEHRFLLGWNTLDSIIVGEPTTTCLPGWPGYCASFSTCPDIDGHSNR